MAEYEIHFSKVRAAKGLKPYAVMEIVDEGFSRGVSQHDTREEAEAALAECVDNNATVQAELRAQERE